MSSLIFIRHGETAMAGRFCGHSDPELNPAGETQATRAAEEVAKLGVQRIYSSDLLRASQTATVVGLRIGVKVEVRRDLREICFGLWEGLNWPEIEDRYPAEAKRWLDEFPSHTAPCGEAYEEFTKRVDAAISALLQEAATQTTAVVTHRGVMRYALTKSFGFTEADAWSRTAPYGAVVIVAIGSRNGTEDQSISTRELPETVKTIAGNKER
jgi:alpha-ribazole phosphatase/probable phosphoglycerate mutase